jgi:polyhydroxybutyrate depolymerase
VASRPSAGCSVAPVSPGQQTVLLSAHGVSGWYIRELPPSYTGRTPVPLVVDLHGYAEPASLQAPLSGLGQYGAREGFAVVTPQVQGSVPMWDTSLDGADMAWFGSLLDNVEATMCVDENRLFVTGYSDGAFFTSAIVCRYASRVAAVAPVAGIQAVPGCHPSRPVPVVAFHGTADPFVSYTGGLGRSALNLPAANGSNRTLGQSLHGAALRKLEHGPSIPQMAEEWARRNGCGTTASYRRVAADVTLISYPCPAGAKVELYRVSGGGHAWPGSELSRSLASVVGRTTLSISADQLMWRFFEGHPLRAGR